RSRRRRPPAPVFAGRGVIPDADCAISVAKTRPMRTEKGGHTMTSRLGYCLVLALTLVSGLPLAAQDQAPTPRPTAADDSVKRNEVVVVTASRQEEELA